MTQTHDTEPAKPRPAGRRPRWSTVIKVAALGVVIIAVLIWGANWLHHRLTHVTSSDARVAAHVITVSSRLAGRISQFDLRRGDHLHEQEVVAKLYRKPAKLKLQRLKAKLAAANARVEAEKTRLGLVQRQIQAGVKQARAELAAAKAMLQVARAKSRRAHDKAQRIARLYKANSISKRKRNAARYTAQARARAVDAAKKQVVSAKIALTNAKTGLLSQPPMHLPSEEVVKSRLKTRRHRRAAARAAVKHQKNRLHDLIVRAPITGVVDKRFINPGEYVSSGQPIIMMHAPKKVWILARIKGTSISELAVGQPVDIHVDAWPDRDYSGHVQVIGQAATNQFNLIPPPNPSGNFTKITQRIPVRISIDYGDKTKLSPGMMVEVDIATDKGDDRDNSP